MNTIFHKILAGEIPCHKIYEDDHVLSFLDISPHAKGHTLVIPKIFAETLLDLPDEALMGYITGIKRTQERIVQVLKPDGCNMGWNMGAAAGQAVPYLHCHIMPRWDGDGGGNMHSIIDNPQVDVAGVAALFTA